MSGESKFIQITTTSAPSKDGTVIKHLFALDQEGDVWTYQWDAETWAPLSSNRAAVRQKTSVL